MPAWLDALNAAPACGSHAQASAFRRRLWARYGKNAEFRAFAAAAHRWQTDYEACGRIQDEAEAWVRGDSGSPETLSLLNAVARAGALGPPMYRGFAEPSSSSEVLARYAPGTLIEMPLVSFTSHYVWALEFAWLSREANEGTEVVFLLREDAHAVRIDSLAPDEVHWREREWVTGGRFVVTSVDYRPDRERVDVYLTQESYFDVGQAHSPR